MDRIAVFGSSYVVRVGKCWQHDFGGVIFFGQGGMTAGSLFTSPRYRRCLDELVAFRPNIVYVCLGGNDISSRSSPGKIVYDILKIYNFLSSCGVRTILIQSIVPRGSFRGELTGHIFDKQRRSVNTRLKTILKESFLEFGISFPNNYLSDLVHFNADGLRKHSYFIRRSIDRVVNN